MNDQMSATDAMELAEDSGLADGATMAYAAELCGADDEAQLIDMLCAEGYFCLEAKGEDNE